SEHAQSARSQPAGDRHRTPGPAATAASTAPDPQPHRDGHRQRGGLADHPPGHHQSGHRHGAGPAGPAGAGAARRSTRVRDALMYLKRSITVNCDNRPVQELDYGPVNLYSGGNGSGKTTAADALQTLMTAAHDNLFNYNPGQAESTQRGRGGKQVR